MIRLALLLWCFAFPALASQHVWPALYDVSGVASDDSLNIRTMPDAQSGIIDTLPFNAKDVEVISLDTTGNWAQVNSGENSGWVSLTFLTRQPGQDAINLLKIRSCFGTEPFWSLTLPTDSDAPVTFSKLGEPDIQGVISERISSQNRTDESAHIFWFGAAGSFAAFISQTSCNDGMFDTAYGLKIGLLLNHATATTLLSGCCSLSP